MMTEQARGRWTPVSTLVWLIVVAGLILSQVGCRCFENCRFPGRRGRDVGRVQNTVGPGYSEIQPRTAVQPFSGAVLNGPSVPATNVAQGNRLEVAGPMIGAQVPVAATRDGLPPGAIDPLSPNARPFPNSAVVAVPAPAVVPQPVMMPTPVPVAVMPTSPMVMTQPMPATIPVVFNSPVTRSATVAIGTAMPMASSPMGVGVMPGQPIPMAVGGNAATGMNGLAPNYAQGGFLSGNNTGGLRLRPRMPDDPTVRPAGPGPDGSRPNDSAPPRSRPSDRPAIRPDAPVTPNPRATSPLPEKPPVPAVPEGIPLPTGPSDPLPPPPKSVPKGESPKNGDDSGLDDFLPKLSIPDAPDTAP
jgi:hypothetical protein